MAGILANRTYRHLFGAQLVALTGTGLATVALGLLAYDLAGERAGLVLGTALTIKMVAYVLVAPLAAALAERLDRRRMLVALDLVRGAVAIGLPFVTEVWQVYVLIFLLQSASAGFTPAFQASVPDVLPAEDEYTRALSLSRLAMDMESLLSPMLAAALLTLMSFDNLFWGTAIGFAASALLVVSVSLPSPKATARRGIYDRTTRGLRLYLATPRLRALLALNGVISSIGAMVIVNTVVIVRVDLGLGESAVALALAGFGLGSMLAALALPRLLKQVPERQVMLAGGAVGTASLAVLAGIWAGGPLQLEGLALGWAGVGLGYSAMLTPSGRLIARSGPPEDRPALFAAQFTLSHACWLVAYPLSGMLITGFGSAWAMAGLALSGALCLLLAWRIWPDEPG
ncbi:MFS transporter [Aliiroseovarius sp.]|uniref:MFS transporter n=1 Tax=Aliiroseovarius sp. TaxID=1872442 RepID=UPI00261D587A|nr:MFS transporter [Aliiroseovarius sp.]